MTFTPGRFYRYRKALSGANRSSLSVGNVYRFIRHVDFFPTTKQEFVMSNSFNEEFSLEASYQVLDEVRLEEIFIEVPKPSWWDEPRQASGY